MIFWIVWAAAGIAFMVAARQGYGEYRKRRRQRVLARIAELERETGIGQPEPAPDREPAWRLLCEWAEGKNGALIAGGMRQPVYAHSAYAVTSGYIGSSGVTVTSTNMGTPLGVVLSGESFEKVKADLAKKGVILH